MQYIRNIYPFRKYKTLKISVIQVPSLWFPFSYTFPVKSWKHFQQFLAIYFVPDSIRYIFYCNSLMVLYLKCFQEIPHCSRFQRNLPLHTSVQHHEWYCGKSFCLCLTTIPILRKYCIALRKIFRNKPVYCLLCINFTNRKYFTHIYINLLFRALIALD